MNGSKIRYTYRCCVICLSKVAIDTACARGVDNSAILLLEHVRICRLCDLVRSTHVDCHNDVPLVIGHVGECLVSEDASIVDQDINSAVVVDGGLDYRISIFNRCFVADCSTSELLDFLHYGIGIDEIVDDDLGTTFGEL